MTRCNELSACRWWPGRTDEVRRVADSMRRIGQPDGHTTNGDLAVRTNSDVAIVLDAISMNNAVAEAIAAALPGER